MSEYLKTGCLGNLKPGLTKLEVEHILGPPDATGGTSRKYKRPSIYLYGNMEIFFDEPDREKAGTIHIDRPWGGNEYKLPTVWLIDDWDLKPNQTIAEVSAYLQKHSIPYVFQEADKGFGARIKTGNNKVELYFAEDDLLDSLYSSLRE